jgi:RimJ/RimL family protein N-acetyltransferase
VTDDSGIDLSALVRPLVVPAGYRAPLRLVHGDLVARALSREDLRADVDGINASVELIRATRGGDWPTGPVTDDEDYVDLVWHECELREGYSFSYALYEHDRDYLGCCYLYPVGRRTPLSTDLLACDVDVSWWVTTEAWGRGWYPRVQHALEAWLADDFPFTNPHWSNVDLHRVRQEM